MQFLRSTIMLLRTAHFQHQYMMFCITFDTPNDTRRAGAVGSNMMSLAGANPLLIFGFAGDNARISEFL